MRLFLVSLLAITVAAPVLAQTFRAVNRLYVVPLSADTFEVIEDRGVGGRGLWCAASDYVRAIGRDSSRKRMYILEPRGDAKTVPNRKSVVFTLAPDDKLRNTSPSYSVSVTRAGENLEVGHAYTFCQAIIDELFDRF